MTDLDAARLADLERRLARIEDVEKLHRLRYRYHELINSNEWDKVADLFTVDAVMDYGHMGAPRGREAIARFFGAGATGVTGSDAPEEPPPFVKQFVHAHDVRLHAEDPDRASGVSYLEAKPVYRGESFLVSGRFDDEYRRVDGQWLFSEVKLEVWFMVPAREGWAGQDRIKMSL